jgi:phosphoesterase RecJ-like protein
MKIKVEKIIRERGKEFQHDYNRTLNAIKRYDTIVIFRHIKPDYDAMGTQMGLYTWLKDNFPKKEIHFVGDNHVSFTPRLFPETERLNDEFFKKQFLGIIVDVGDKKRIADPRFKKAKFKIKIDHHPDVEHWGNISMVDTNYCASSELVMNMILNFKGDYVLSPEAAKYFYMGIVGDSGRFMYSSTTDHTFAIAKYLVETGIKISPIYQQMYMKKIDDLKVVAYILNNFSVSEHGVAYYILDKAIQDKLEITSERGKENVNLFANIDGVNAWCSITEDAKDNCWRISIRSKEKAINEVAKKWEGGGHAQASGAKIDKLEQLPLFIKDLDDLFI